MPKAREGDEYVLKSLIPTEEEGLTYPLSVGTKAKVRELVPAEESGAHNDEEDSVVIEWEDPEGAIRAMAISEDAFADLFGSA